MAMSEAKKRANAKYLREHYEEIRFAVRIGRKQQVADWAASKGMSLRAYMLDLISRDMDTEID